MGLGNDGLGNDGLGNDGLGNDGRGNDGLGNDGLANNALADNAQVVVRRLRRALEDLGIRPQPVAGGNWIGLASQGDARVTFQSVNIADAARLANLLEDLATVGSHSRRYFPESDYAPVPDEYLAQRDVFTPVTSPLDPPYPASQHHPRVPS